MPMAQHRLAGPKDFRNLIVHEYFRVGLANP